MPNQNIIITKSSGEKVAFDSEKLRRSLEHSGADPAEIERVVTEVNKRIIEGMSTRKIYHMAYAILRKKSNRAAGRYRLKKAIFDLGPTGYPFESFVGELLRYQGYRAEVGKIIQGKCVQHEVDVVAEKEDRRFMIECKFHSDPGRKSDVKVSLYIHSRFLDIEELWKKQPDGNTRFHQGWLVTNTRFTDDALQYGKCAGLHMISWDYPAKGNLRQLIDQSGLHPITALQSLTNREKQDLLEKQVVLCGKLNKENLDQVGIRSNRITTILNEVNELIEPVINRP